MEARAVRVPHPAPIRLSPESIRQWRQCPHAFWHRYLQRSPREAVFSRPMQRGNCIHHLLRACFVQRRAQGMFPAELSPLAANFLPRRLYANQDAWREDVREASHTVRQYLAALSDGAADATRTLAIERVYRYDYLPLPTFALSARADRVYRAPGGGLRIVDYKSGAPGAYDLFQMAALHLCVAATPGTPADARPITVGIVFLTRDYPETLAKRFTRDELREYRDRIGDIAAAIRTERAFTPTPGPACRYCPYRALCPAIDADGEY